LRSTPKFTLARTVLDLFAFQPADGLFEKLDVHVEADGVDMAALLPAEKVPGPSNFKVERGHAEAASKVTELPDRR
jgi:hypothetical protein